MIICLCIIYGLKVKLFDVLTDKNDINDKKLKNNNCKLSINP